MKTLTNHKTTLLADSFHREMGLKQERRERRRGGGGRGGGREGGGGRRGGESEEKRSRKVNLNKFGYAVLAIMKYIESNTQRDCSPNKGFAQRPAKQTALKIAYCMRS